MIDEFNYFLQELFEYNYKKNKKAKAKLIKKSSIHREVKDANIDPRRQGEMADSKYNDAVMNLSEICQKVNGSECKKSYPALSKDVNLLSKTNLLPERGAGESLVHFGYETRTEEDGVKHSFCSDIEQTVAVNSDEYSGDHVPADHLTQFPNNGDTLEYVGTSFAERYTCHIDRSARNNTTLIQSDIGDQVKMLRKGLEGNNFQVSSPLPYYGSSEKQNQGNLEITKTTCRASSGESSDYYQIGRVKQTDQRLPLEWSAYLSNSPTGWNEFWNQYGEQLVWNDWCEKFQESFASLNLSLGEIFFLHQNDQLNCNVLFFQIPVKYLLSLREISIETWQYYFTERKN